MEIVAERKKPEDERLLKPLASQKFPLLGGNAVLEAIPRVVHFGGFRLNQTVTQKLRILNKSTASTRMHIVLPSEPPFHAENQRKGTIYPGMSEEIVVSFTPTEYKYYYDCVKVHSEAGNFIVPLHAYPVVNNVQFPAQVHFGTQPLGHRSTRVVAIECSVPIEFEFRINVLRAHTSITVEPLQGTIPPNSRAEITIAFQPIVMANVFSEIELMVSQFGFKPMTCTISGSSAPDLKLESTLTKLETTIDSSSTSVPEATDEASSNDKPASTKAKAKKTKRHSSPPRNPADDLLDEDENDIIDGIKIPKKMEGVHATNFVLTQQPGKLKPKDLKRAIEANRALRKRQKAEQEALRQKTGSSGGRLSFDVLLMEESVSSKPTTRQLKELVFLQELQEIDKMEKELEFQSHRDSIGDSTLSQDDVQFIKDIRVYHAKERARHERETLRTTFKSHGSSAASTPPMRAALPAFHQPSHVPDFNPYKNDLWAKRKRILARFIQVVSKLILRLRADRRLRMIKAWLGNASSRLEVRKMVDRDWRFAQVTTSNLSTPTKSQDPTADQIPISSIVTLHSFPLYAETDSRTRLPVEATTDIAFHNFDLFPLHVPLEANEMGYKPHPALVVPQYAPLETARRLHVGAQYEAGVRLPRPISDAARAAADAIAGPVSPSELNWEYTVPNTFFCIPPATPRVYTPETWPTETDPEFVLQPEFFDLDLKLTRQQVLADTPGSISVAIKTPYMLHTAWLCRREHPMHPYTPLWELPPSAPSIIDTTQDHIPIDPLSDSESDNDEPPPESTLPTLDDARKLFEEHLDFDLKSLERFPRDEAYLKLDAEYTAYRYDLSMRLPLRMQEIAKRIKDPKMQFVLQGHGDPLPLHTFEPESCIELGDSTSFAAKRRRNRPFHTTKSRVTDTRSGATTERMNHLGFATLHAHVEELHKDRRLSRRLRHGQVDRAQARLQLEYERDQWKRHAADHIASSPEKTHGGLNLKQIEKELRLTEERDWMKKHKKKRPHEFTIAEKKILREWFDLLDADHSGTISNDELQEVLLTLGLATTMDETLRIIRSIDSDESGSVDFEEFVLALTPQHSDESTSDRTTPFVGLKESMAAQSKGLLDAKTHVSIERRRFLVSAIMAQDSSADTALNNAVRKEERRKKAHPTKHDEPTRQRLHGLEDVITRNARARREAAAKEVESKAAAARRKLELQAEAEMTHRLDARRLHRRSNTASHTGLPELPPPSASSSMRKSSSVVTIPS